MTTTSDPAKFRSSFPQGLVRSFSRSAIEETSPSYRILPIFSGVVIPFSILLAIPSITGRWYIRTGEKDVVVDSKPNTVLLETATTISLVCVILASGCLVVRFAERGIKPMTLLSIFLLTVHDMISISTVTAFGVEHRFDDGFTYGQPFWMTVCSTIISTTTNVTLIIDYVSTPNFANSGSGLTRKQRSLVVIIIVLFFYIAIGALVQSVLLELSFIDALYFTVVSIETVGFGDIHPTTAGSRAFIVVYITFGILNLAVAVASTREALLEGMVVYLQNRIRAIKQKDRERRVRGRWRDAIKWRLRAQRLPIWIEAPEGGLTLRGLRGALKRRTGGAHRRSGQRRLNVEALTAAQLEAAALEAGAPLMDILPPGFVPHDRNPDTWRPPPSDGPTPIHSPKLTHIRMGGMAHLLMSFAIAVSIGEHALPARNSVNEEVDDDDDESARNVGVRTGVPMSRTLTLDGPTLASMVEKEEQLASKVRLVAALILFFVFWMLGSAVFSKTEKWSFGSAVYFCFISFTTVGYGELAPRTAAGRSIFVAWALLGIGTMTILIAILAEAYSTRYRQAIQAEIYQKAIPSAYPMQRQQTINSTFSPSGLDPIYMPISGEQNFPGRSRAVGFAEVPAALDLEKENANASCDTLSKPSASRPSSPLNLESSAPVPSLEAFEDAVQHHVRELRVLLQAERTRPDGETGGDPNPLQDMLEDMERRLMEMTSIMAKR